MSPQSHLRSLAPAFVGALVILSCSLGAAGCAGTLEAGPVIVSGQDDVSWDDTIPGDFDRYPHESYGGRDVYFIGGSWHYRSGNRWATYRRAPPALGPRRGQAPAGRRQVRAPERSERTEHR
jgi:hypothetical protein